MFEGIFQPMHILVGAFVIVPLVLMFGLIARRLWRY